MPQRQQPAGHRQQAFDELRDLLAVHETVEGWVVRSITAKVAGESVAADLTREERDIPLRLTCLESLNCAGPVVQTFLPAFEAAIVRHTTREEREEPTRYPGVLRGRDPRT